MPKQRAKMKKRSECKFFAVVFTSGKRPRVRALSKLGPCWQVGPRLATATMGLILIMGLGLGVYSTLIIVTFNCIDFIDHHMKDYDGTGRQYWRIQCQHFCSSHGHCTTFQALLNAFGYVTTHNC
jgi:hypothetical protein